VKGFVLDTNVVSEPKKLLPEPKLRAWFERHDPETLYLTTTVVCELAEGIERLPQGRRRRDFEQWLDRLLEDEFRDRVLNVDVAAARMFGKLVAASYAQGRVPGMADAQIAAVAARHGLTVATRDVRDFAAFGVPIVNPWSEE
jgi:predicted nucleic acid-binding protein